MPHSQAVDRERQKILKEVVRHPWHEPILQALAEGSSQYAEIRRAIEAATADVLGEGQLTATLNRLRKLGVVDKRQAGRPRWTITRKGGTALRDVRYLARAQARRARQADREVEAAPIAVHTTARADIVEVLRPRTSSPQGGVSLDGSEAPAGIDFNVAHPARRYNYWLGGKDNFLADRESGDEFEALIPGLRQGVREARDVLRRAVNHLAANEGIRQFLDIGSGLPTADNTHEVAQRAAPDAHIVYVDFDPLVMTHAQALLTSSPKGKTAYIQADLREPNAILNTATVRNTLDLSRPVALLLTAVMHFVPGKGAALPIVRDFMAALPPGSFLVLTHVTHDFASPEIRAAHEQMLREGRSDIWPRPKEEIEQLFTGLELLPPGIVPNTLWRPHPETPDLPLHIVGAWAGVGKKVR